MATESTLHLERGLDSPATVIAEHCHARHQVAIPLGPLGADIQWPFFISRVPEKIDSLVVFTDTMPAVQFKAMRQAKTWVRPGVQVRVRSREYQLAYRKANSLLRFIADMQHQFITLEGGHYEIHHASLQSGLMSLGQDAQGRSDVAFNVLLTFRVLK